MKKVIFAIFVLTILILTACAPQQSTQPPTPIAKEPVLLTPNELEWKPAPPSLPQGAKIVVIEGNLSNADPFIFRLILPQNYKLAPHTHPAIEHVTVISGTLYFGTGSEFVPEKAKAYPAGSVIIMPIGHAMFGFTKDQETIIQVHGVGPWGLTYLNPDDDPRKK